MPPDVAQFEIAHVEARFVQQPVNRQFARKSADIDPSVGDDGGSEFRKGADPIVARRIHVAVPHLLRQVGRLEGAQRARHSLVHAVLARRMRRPQDRAFRVGPIP